MTDDEVPNRVIHLNGNGNRGTTEAFALAKQQLPTQPQVNWNGWHVKMIVRKLQSTSWEEQLLVLTPDVLALGPVAGGHDEVIPLHEIDRLQEQRGAGRVERGWSPARSICMLFTVDLQGAEKGYNLGRKYCISADFPLQIQEDGTGERIVGTEKHVADGKICSCGDFVKCLDVLVSKAKERHQSQTIAAKFARSRLSVGALFDWLPFV